MCVFVFFCVRVSGAQQQAAQQQLHQQQQQQQHQQHMQPPTQHQLHQLQQLLPQSTLDETPMLEQQASNFCPSAKVAMSLKFSPTGLTSSPLSKVKDIKREREKKISHVLCRSFLIFSSSLVCLQTEPITAGEALLPAGATSPTGSRRRTPNRRFSPVKRLADAASPRALAAPLNGDEMPHALAQLSGLRPRLHDEHTFSRINRKIGQPPASPSLS
jgi:hypothetical protein